MNFESNKHFEECYESILKNGSNENLSLKDYLKLAFNTGLEIGYTAGQTDAKGEVPNEI